MPRIPEAFTHFAHDAWGSNLIDSHAQPSYLKNKITPEMWLAGSRNSHDVYAYLPKPNQQLAKGPRVYEPNPNTMGPHLPGTAYAPLNAEHIPSLIAKLKLDAPKNTMTSGSETKHVFSQSRLFSTTGQTVLNVVGKSPLNTHEVFQLKVAQKITDFVKNNGGKLPTAHEAIAHALPIERQAGTQNTVLHTTNANGESRFYALSPEATTAFQLAMQPKVEQMLRFYQTNKVRSFNFDTNTRKLLKD